MKEPRAASTAGLGNLDRHDAQAEQLVDERTRNLRVFVHVADERPDLAVGEFVDAVLEETLVVRECRERRDGGHVRESVSRTKKTPAPLVGRPACLDDVSRSGCVKSYVGLRPETSPAVFGSGLLNFAASIVGFGVYAVNVQSSRSLTHA